jgi:hypothetical protein
MGRAIESGGAAFGFPLARFNGFPPDHDPLSASVLWILEQVMKVP